MRASLSRLLDDFTVNSGDECCIIHCFIIFDWIRWFGPIRSLNVLSIDVHNHYKSACLLKPLYCTSGLYCFWKILCSYKRWCTWLAEQNMFSTFFIVSISILCTCPAFGYLGKSMSFQIRYNLFLTWNDYLNKQLQLKVLSLQKSVEKYDIQN